MDDKDLRIKELERALFEIEQTAQAAIDEAHDLVGARMLISVQWIRKLAARAQGKSEE